MKKIEETKKYLNVEYYIDLVGNEKLLDHIIRYIGIDKSDLLTDFTAVDDNILMHLPKYAELSYSDTRKSYHIDSATNKSTHTEVTVHHFNTSTGYSCILEKAILHYFIPEFKSIKYALYPKTHFNNDLFFVDTKVCSMYVPYTKLLHKNKIEVLKTIEEGIINICECSKKALNNNILTRNMYKTLEYKIILKFLNS